MTTKSIPAVFVLLAPLRNNKSGVTSYEMCEIHIIIFSLINTGPIFLTSQSLFPVTMQEAGTDDRELHFSCSVDSFYL